LKKVVASIGLIALFCLVFGCRDKEAMAELEKFKTRA
jgi:hypothetical protein